MGWFVAFCLAAILAVVAWRHQVFLRHWRHLQKILSDLAEGREPKSFVFLTSARFTALAADLERLAEAQERLRRRRTQEEKNLQAILGSMEEAVMVIDRRRSIRLVNPSFIRLFQVRFDPINQSSLQTIGNAALEKMIGSTFETAEPQAGDVSIDTKPARHIAVNAVPMRDAAGGDAIVVIFRDVTRLRQLEEVRREFVANVSHELRTPLSIFHGYLENLMDDPALIEGPHGEALTIMRKHSLRLNALLEDLLILARLESRADLFHFEEVALDSFLDSVIASWRMRTEEKGIALRAEVADRVLPLRADPLRLEQVVNNLIDNALNYSDPGGAITVRAAEIDGAVEIRVEDSGIGIPPSDLPHIFERFYRADKARSRQRGGTGLGLSIVKHIVQAHGGTVAAESAPGSGTTIILRFPRRVQEDAPAADATRGVPAVS